MMDAATLCDVLASETLAQNKRRGGNRASREMAAEMAATFKRAGNEIMRMRDRVKVPA